MTKHQFLKSLTGQTVLAGFSAPWCGPCQALAPVLRDLAQKYKEKTRIIEINIDSEQELATDYMVQSIPTIILFKDGKELTRMVGLRPQAEIEKELDQRL